MVANPFPPGTREIIDLRSDTVTRPSAGMYEAMQTAFLGDDVLEDDPSVIELERLSAQVTRKEAAMFVPSGTMGNQIAVATHTKPGDAMIIEQEAHILYYEVGAPAVLNGVVSWTLPSHNGTMDPNDVEKRILKPNLHTPGTALVCLENTHNRAGGAITPIETMKAYRAIADKAGIKVHLDGARVFNAAVALGVPVGDITGQVDTVSFCLSKGLGAPVGSVLAGPAEFIERARIWRKRLGGGMRQAGLLAACGVYAVQHNVDRLADDHARAKKIAAGLAGLPGISVSADATETNIVLIETEKPAAEWQKILAENGLWCFPVAENRLRLVFHLDVDDAKTERAIEIFQKLASGS